MSHVAERDTVSVPFIACPEQAAARRDAVTGLRAHASGRAYALPAPLERFTLGASPSCDVVIDDEYVSSVHCVLERRDIAKLVVRDRSSKNGTYINGNRIEVGELSPGSLLRVGATTLIALGGDTRTSRPAVEQLRGNDPAFREAIDMALRAAPSECSVLVIGETGTGKELVARAIHEASVRRAGPFVAINCGGIPRELVESELFGHEKGAFTGAVGDRQGVFVQADGGTLFLDELGELPREQQPSLLRALETRRVRKVGGQIELGVDVRVVAATNRLALAGADSPLRQDLYHRVATVVIELPPLRARTDDVDVLVSAFLAELEPKFGRRWVARETMVALREHVWPGNVRELRHAVQRAVTLCPDELSLVCLLPPRKSWSAPLPAQSADVEPRLTAPLPRIERSARPDLSPFESAKRDLVLDAYDRHRSIRKAAAALGLPKSTFADYLRRYM